MKLRYMLYVVLMMQGLDASTYTLKNVLHGAKQEGAMTKAQYYERLSLAAKNRADTAGEPFVLDGSVTRAVPDEGDSGIEQSVGLSKKVMMPGVLSQERQIRQLNDDADMIEKEMQLLDFENSLKNLYHQHCLDTQKYKSFKSSYDDFSKLYKKKQRAYQHQEISKMELMQLETQKDKLYAQLQITKIQSRSSKDRLQILANIPKDKKVVFSCNDLYPIQNKITYNKSYSLSEKAYQKRIESTKLSLKRYSRSIDSFDTHAAYSNEIDTKRYSIGVSIPLNFTTRRFEEERAAAMYKNSALQYDFEQKMQQKQSLLLGLSGKLESHALMIKALKKNMDKYKKRLFPMIQKSFDLGEISVLEYLMNRQKLYEIQKAIYAEKAAYYTTLFRLHTISETKDKR